MHWYASLIAVAVLVVGVPLGVILGRWIVTLLTNALGIVPGVDLPIVVLSLIVVAALIVVNAAGPAAGAQGGPGRWHSSVVRRVVARVVPQLFGETAGIRPSG